MSASISVAQAVAGVPPLVITTGGLPLLDDGVPTAIVQRSTDGEITWTTVRSLAAFPVEPGTVYETGEAIFDDTFSRVEVAGWNTPDFGGAWTGGDTVDGDLGIITVVLPDVAGPYDASFTQTERDIRVTLRNLSVGTPPEDGNLEHQVYFSDNLVVIVQWNKVGDNFVDIRVGDGAGLLGSAAIAGADLTTDVDVVVERGDTGVRVWAALSSMGVNLADPPLITATTTDPGGNNLLLARGYAYPACSNLPIDIRWGNIFLETLVPTGAAPTTDDWEFRPDVVNSYRLGLNEICGTMRWPAGGGFWPDMFTEQYWDTSTTGTGAVSSDSGGSVSTGEDGDTVQGELWEGAGALVDIGDLDWGITVAANDLAPGDAVTVELWTHYDDWTGKKYRTLITFTDPDVTIQVYDSGGALSPAVTLTDPYDGGAGIRVRVRVREGYRISVKAWKLTAGPEPTDWQIDSVVSGLAARVTAGSCVISVTHDSVDPTVAAFRDMVLDIDRPTFLDTTTITPTLTAHWLCSVMRSFLNGIITVSDYDEPGRTDRGGAIAIHQRSMPIGLVELASGRGWALIVRTATLAAARQLEYVIASGDVFWLLVPSASHVPGGYYRVGKYSAQHNRSQGTTRWHTLPLAECARPGPDIVTATATWDTILALYGDWPAVVAAHPSGWDSVLELVGDPSEVVVDA